ncbi:predicted protein [Histoplasma capsulatum G186AR]|uniref:Uncharacterized protein n=1 Tax=Ajellomyces capsulatus (strain G186AR / H82 / ATCC MYA-2454 / RMSCC 2432) TaxID=447093 RepID=C0NWV7_AJECG|nr:uncharacterized protein HCBG_07637 [Histoplasma capsulatum G186AR]EEH04412.1 predicted protein [Histoplasma capsulatum G186AR]
MFDVARSIMKRVKDYIYGPRRVPEELTVLRPVEIGGEKNSTELTDGAPGFHVVSTGYHRRDVCLRAVPTRLPSGILDREPDAAQLEGGKGRRRESRGLRKTAGWSIATGYTWSSEGGERLPIDGELQPGIIEFRAVIDFNELLVCSHGCH